jgi:hypothetical protein
LSALDAGTLYLRIFLGAKPFKSAQMDSLAERMDVSGLMSTRSDERYFLTNSNMAAISLGNKLLFGARYYGSLTERQRLAVAAHEFAHVLGKDGAHRRNRVVLPAAVVSALLGTAGFAITNSLLALECILACTFVLSAVLFSSAYSGHYSDQELRSDDVAATFVDGESLVEALTAAESMVAKKVRTAGGGKHPATPKRVEAIRSRAVRPERSIGPP